MMWIQQGKCDVYQGKYRINLRIIILQKNENGWR